MDYKEITKNAYDDVASDYSKRDSEIVPESFDVKNVLDKFIGMFPEGALILDIGSGGGRDSRYMHAHGLKVTGIDFSEQMIMLAQKEAPEIKYVHMDFENLDFPGESFDGVWANASLHHVPKAKLHDVLSQIYKILKKDGTFFIKIKHGDFDGIRENEKFGRKIKRQFSYYRPDELAEMLEFAGFSILEKYLTTGDEWLDIFAKK